MLDILDLELGKNGVLICENKQDESQKVDFKTLEYRAFCYGVQNNILELEKQNEDDLKSINFGLSMHYMLEMFGEFKKDNLSYAKDMMLNKYGSVLEDSEVEDISQRVLRLVEDEEFKTLSLGEVYREKALRYKNNLRYIDLLVKCEDGSWNVLDYKSSMAYGEKHLKQVRYYVEAIKEITKSEVNGYICYLLEDKIKIVKI